MVVDLIALVVRVIPERLSLDVVVWQVEQVRLDVLRDGLTRLVLPVETHHAAADSLHGIDAVLTELVLLARLEVVHDVRVNATGFGEGDDLLVSKVTVGTERVVPGLLTASLDERAEVVTDVFQDVLGVMLGLKGGCGYGTLGFLGVRKDRSDERRGNLTGVSHARGDSGSTGLEVVLDLDESLGDYRVGRQGGGVEEKRVIRRTGGKGRDGRRIASDDVAIRVILIEGLGEVRPLLSFCHRLFGLAGLSGLGFSLGISDELVEGGSGGGTSRAELAAGALFTDDALKFRPCG